jgi:hypothetical protein
MPVHIKHQKDWREGDGFSFIYDQAIGKHNGASIYVEKSKRTGLWKMFIHYSLLDGVHEGQKVGNTISLNYEAEDYRDRWALHAVEVLSQTGGARLYLRQDHKYDDEEISMHDLIGDLISSNLRDGSFLLQDDEIPLPLFIPSSLPALRSESLPPFGGIELTHPGGGHIDKYIQEPFIPDILNSKLQ